jgi:hypothetical protein
MKEKAGAGTNHGAQQRSRSKRPSRRVVGREEELRNPLVRRGGERRRREEESQARFSPIMPVLCSTGDVRWMFCWGTFLYGCGLDRLLGPMQRSGRGLAA